jgi:hypothetical protein
MAHFLAMNESRFRFSHDHAFLSVIGIESFLLNMSTTGSIRMLDGRPVWYHKAMDYIYRPKEFENYSLLDFFENYTSVRCNEATKTGQVAFTFLTGHAFQTSHCIVNRERAVIATFPWNWLRSTFDFAESLLQYTAVNAKDYNEREEYCRRFLMLFKPFRLLSDFLDDADSYQMAFRCIANNEGFTDEIEEYANNIQDIHNSLRVEMPINILKT